MSSTSSRDVKLFYFIFLYTFRVANAHFMLNLWAPNRNLEIVRVNKAVVFKTTFNCSHALTKNVISQLLPDLDYTVCYKSTVTLASLRK